MVQLEQLLEGGVVLAGVLLQVGLHRQPVQRGRPLRLFFQKRLVVALGVRVGGLPFGGGALLGVLLRGARRFGVEHGGGTFGPLRGRSAPVGAPGAVADLEFADFEVVVAGHCLQEFRLCLQSLWVSIFVEFNPKFFDE